MIKCFALAMAAALLLAPALARAAGADDLLPPEQAFRFAARAVDEQRVEVRYDIADGYYLYRQQFKFKAQAADGSDIALGEPEIPKGKVKFDETFQKELETYRHAVAIRLPLAAPATAPYKLAVTSQGCADLGVCYPPMTSFAEVDPKSGAVRSLSAEQAAAWGAAVPAAAALAPAAAGATTAGPAAPPTDAATAALRSGSFWLIVGVFFVAGLLLAFTPCMLPMLPILSSLIVGSQAQQSVSRKRGFSLALSYSLGMALLYTLLGIAAGLAGEGLAAALQKPWVLAGFAILLVLLALSMFGVYELQLPAALQGRLSASANKMP
ncbi:MAG TPA: protein-disulfide reductase DsbD domain-containing protein, partial [Methylibium sp.]